MNNDFSARREFLKESFIALGAIIPAGLTANRSPVAENLLELPQSTSTPLKVVCVGAHPDDPESGCGGTLAKYAEQGHRVTIIYLTRGERGDWTKPPKEVAAIRTKEAEDACRILGAKPLFVGQIDAATEITNAHVQAMAKILLSEEPNVVFTHWLIDTNLDHQLAGTLSFRAYLLSQRQFQLYFFEVETGRQTLGFNPTDYIDITASREKKKAALFAHKSQKGEQIYKQYHEIMENFRGREAGVAAAEAFVRLTDHVQKI